MLLSVRLEDDLGMRLEGLAKKTHRTKSFYIKEALLNYIEDLEDIYIAEKRLSDVKKGKDKIISSEEFWNESDN